MTGGRTAPSVNGSSAESTTSSRPVDGTIVFVDPRMLLEILVGWLIAAGIVAWLFSRWLRHVRGDFDKDE